MAPEEIKTSRRSFLDTLLGLSVIGWLATIFYPIFHFLKVPLQVESVPTSVIAASLKDMKPNQGVVFRFGNKPAILIMTPDRKFKAFSAICTHLDCTVQFRADMQKIWCACHNGMYDLTGRNVAGPPPRPLDEYKVVTKGDQILVSKA